MIFFIFLNNFNFWDCFKKIVVNSFAVNFQELNIIFYSKFLVSGYKMAELLQLL